MDRSGESSGMRNGARAHRRSAVMLISLSVLLAACGSTVPRAQIEAAQQQGASGLGPAPAPSTTLPGASLPPGVAPPAGQLPPGVTQGPGGTIVTTGGTPLVGVTATSFFFGGFYQVNQGAANEAIGGGGLDSGDARKAYKAVIDEINAHGGLARRKIVPIYHRVDAASTETADQQDQRACNLFFQDNKVAVTDLGGSVVDECVKKAGAFQVGGALAGGHLASLPDTYTRYPHRIDLNAMNMIRIGEVTIDALAKFGYFGSGAKIGIVTWNDDRYRKAVETGYVPALKRYGRSLGVPPAYARLPQTANEIGQTSADVGAAVLRFKTQNVTHVLILDGPAGACGGGCITLEWLQQSQAQRFFPRYGFNDSSSARGLYEQRLLPASQLRASLNVGWTTLDASYDEGWKTNAPRERCFALMRKNDVPLTNLNEVLTALSACSELWFLQETVNRIRGPLTQEGFLASINSLSYGWQSPGAYYNYFGSGRHDGAAGVRVQRFEDGCSCFRYLTTPYRV